MTRFIILAEHVGSDSDRGVWMFIAPDMKVWDTLGLLEFARLSENSARIADRVRNGDD